MNRRVTRNNDSKALTKDLIFTKTRNDNLAGIKNLNLWGNNLEDLSLLREMPNLQVISLSVNSISSLKDFAQCRRLQELYLRKNHIQSLEELSHLKKLPNLKVLWLEDNPCAEVFDKAKDYRLVVLANLPNLTKLDNNIVTGEERKQVSQKQSLHQQSRHQQSYYEQQQEVDSENEFEEETPSAYQGDLLPNPGSNRKSNQLNPYQEYEERPIGSSRHQTQKAHLQQEKSNINIPKNPNIARDNFMANDSRQKAISGSSSSVAHNHLHYQPQTQQSHRKVNDSGIQQSSAFKQPAEHRGSNTKGAVVANSNILIAVLSLLEELDESGIEIVHRQTQKKLQHFDQKFSNPSNDY